MCRLNGQKLVMAFIICLVLAAAEVFACSCVELSDVSFNDRVNNAVNGAAMVFAGKVVGFEYRKGVPGRFRQPSKDDQGRDIEWETKFVKFKAERWWAGEPATEVFLATDEGRSSTGIGSASSCDFYFEVGKTYLVYAHRDRNAFRTHSCTRTSLLSNTKDLQVLGVGKEPVKKKDQPEK